MWKPETVGDVIAERTFELKKGTRRHGQVLVRFGKPVRAKRAQRGDPWWCPIEIVGLDLEGLKPIAGVDSLQALILALEFVTKILPDRAATKGLRVQWLGEDERVVLARHSLARRVDSVVAELFMALKDTAGILAATESAEARATRALVRLMRGKHSADGASAKRSKRRGAA